MMPVRERRERRHLGHQPVDLKPPVVGVMDVPRFGVKRSERRHAADQHAHGMSVVAEPVHDRANILVHISVVGNIVHEIVQLGLIRQLSIQEQIRDFEERAALRKMNVLLLSQIHSLQPDLFYVRLLLGHEGL